jgi:hypothetical protein
MNRSRLLFAAFSIVLSVLILSACGGGSGDPTNPTPGPTPTPAPVPTPTPAPASFVCPLPPSSLANPNDCYEGTPTLGPQINAAIDAVIATRPQLFNMSDTNGGNPRVLDRDAYWAAVKRELEKQGICTIIEKEEFAVKNTNEFNEQWNLWTSAGFVRRRYVTSCAPAWF